MHDRGQRSPCESILSRGRVERQIEAPRDANGASPNSSCNAPPLKISLANLLQSTKGTKLFHAAVTLLPLVSTLGPAHARKQRARCLGFAIQPGQSDEGQALRWRRLRGANKTPQAGRLISAF